MEPAGFFVSVIISVHNGELFLDEAVDSIQRQSYQQLEIIVVDDGSTDGITGTAAKLEANIRYVYQLSSGPPAAHSTGQKMVCCNVNVNDLWSENKLELQQEHLAHTQSVKIVSGHTQRMQLTGTVDGKLLFREWSGPLSP